MRLLPEPHHLLLVQARETEHADLIRDMFPRPRRAQLLQLALQGSPHTLDAAAHSPQIGLPLREELRVIEDERGDAGTVGRRVADLAALKDGELGGDAANGVGGVGPRPGHKMKRAGPLAVQAEVLGEALGNAHLEALLDEVTDGPRVIFKVAGSKALVGAVEERKLALLTQEVGELSPLVAGGVDASGVVGAGVQENDASFRGGLNGRGHAIEVEAFGLRGEVRVGFDGKVDV